jgi:hypothetical protein
MACDVGRNDGRVNSGWARQKRLGLGFANHVEDPMSGASVAFAGAAPRRCDRGRAPAMSASFADADAERIKAPGAIIREARRGAELRAETHK